MKYHIIHNTSVGIAFIGTVLVVIEILREMDALAFSNPENLDIPGFALVIIGSVLASWSAKKMDQQDNQDNP